MKIAGMVVLAALTGWLIRGARFDADPAPAPVIASQPVMASDPLPDPPSLVQRTPLDGSLGQRNLFAYRVEERPAIVAAATPAYVAPMVEAPIPVLVEAPAPAPVPFPYRYIGTFGTARNRVAAFVRDGEITTVRAGDRLGEFVLRSIDLETVQVEGPDGVRRIPMSTSV
jgi:hypothetical protein